MVCLQSTSAAQKNARYETDFASSHLSLFARAVFLQSDAYANTFLSTLLFGLLIVHRCKRRTVDESQDRKLIGEIIPNPDENEYESLNR